MEKDQTTQSNVQKFQSDFRDLFCDSLLPTLRGISNILYLTRYFSEGVNMDYEMLAPILDLSSNCLEDATTKLCEFYEEVMV